MSINLTARLSGDWIFESCEMWLTVLAGEKKFEALRFKMPIWVVCGLRYLPFPHQRHMIRAKEASVG